MNDAPADRPDQPDQAQDGRFDLRWTERLSGQLALGADVYEGPTVEANGHSFEFTVHGTIKDFELFRHSGQVVLQGSVTSPLLGPTVAIDRGTMELFTATEDPLVSELRYTLWFRTADGAKYKVYGFKTVRDDRGLDLWPDTSRLFTSLERVVTDDRRTDGGRTDGRRPVTEVLARGRLSISVFGFALLYLGMRVGPARGSPGWPARLWRQVALRVAFSRWFLGHLARVYGNPFRIRGGAELITPTSAGRSARSLLKYRPRRAVNWLDPRLLVMTAQRVRQSATFDKSFDARQLESSLPAVCDFSTGEDRWVDYVADTGDGFPATYSVAYVMAHEQLEVGGVKTERGRVLVLGGDLVYPTPSRAGYEDRLFGPFESALPYDENEEHHVLAIPGNHDWYDNLKSFAHYFMSGSRWLGGRCIDQRHSFFAAQLPGRWWLLGVDSALDTHLNAKQTDFFEGVKQQMDPGDRVVLVVAKPSWLLDPSSDGGKNQAYIERTFIAEDATLELVLSGDRHHYARYEPDGGGPPIRITCGGGGAYTSGTHHLPETLPDRPQETLPDPPQETLPDRPQETLRATYPDRATSRRAVRGVLTAFLTQPSFLAVSALTYVLLGGLLLASGTSGPSSPSERIGRAGAAAVPGAVARALLASPIALVIWALAAAAIVAFAWSGRAAAGRWRAVAAGMAHAAVQLAVLASCTRLVLGLDARGAAALVVVGGGLALAGAIAVPALCGLYLWLTDRWALHADAVFAVQGRTDCKSFLRLRFDADGTLNVYVYGIAHPLEDWRPLRAPDKARPVHGPAIVPADLPEQSDRWASRGPYVELVDRRTITGRAGGRNPGHQGSAARPVPAGLVPGDGLIPTPLYGCGGTVVVRMIRAALRRA